MSGSLHHGGGPVLDFLTVLTDPIGLAWVAVLMVFLVLARVDLLFASWRSRHER